MIAASTSYSSSEILQCDPSLKRDECLAANSAATTGSSGASFNGEQKKCVRTLIECGQRFSGEPAGPRRGSILGGPSTVCVAISFPPTAYRMMRSDEEILVGGLFQGKWIAVKFPDSLRSQSSSTGLSVAPTSLNQFMMPGPSLAAPSDPARTIDSSDDPDLPQPQRTRSRMVRMV